MYIHVPFCKQACNYCNFHFSTSLANKGALLEALATEIVMRESEWGNKPLQTVYLDGGTPSLLSADELNRLFAVISKHYTIAADAEITLEANPDDLTPAYLAGLKHTPVNRLSIGVQSFHDHDLAYMHRAHNAREAEAAIGGALDAGFHNLSLDLIYGAPTTTDADWETNLTKAAAFSVAHLSCYALTVEPRTALAHHIAKGKTVPPDDTRTAAQWEMLQDFAPTAGFEQYEISNFARRGAYARHNTAYWQGAPYLGIGPSAHSFDGAKVRGWNVANNAAYIRSIAEGVLPHETEQLTDRDRYNEYVMTSLRTVWGIAIEKVERDFGNAAHRHLLEKATSYIHNAQIENHAAHLCLTRAGKLFADGIAADFFLPL